MAYPRCRLTALWDRRSLPDFGVALGQLGWAAHQRYMVSPLWTEGRTVPVSAGDVLGPACSQSGPLKSPPKTAARRAAPVAADARRSGSHSPYPSRKPAIELARTA